MIRFVLCFLLIFFVSPVQAQVRWTFHGRVANGGQIDALAGTDGRIHLITDNYFQFNDKGQVLLREGVGDERQGGYDFPPALAVDTAGNVHILTRHGNFSSDSGYFILYRMRTAAGRWQNSHYIGVREKRNYVVGIAAPTGIPYELISKAGGNVWGDLKIWQTSSGRSTYLGPLANIWRADTDARLRAHGDTLFLVSGKCDGNGAAFFSHARAGGPVLAELRGNMRVHSAGNGRTGAPDLYLDRKGNAHLTYGAAYEVYYNRYDSSRQKVFAADKRLFSNLGGWHLNLGMSAVAASDDGNVVVAVALDPDGLSQGARQSRLLWTYSLDGGKNWSRPEDLGRVTDGGEGRRRPRLVAVGKKFFLFFRDNSVGGISLASVDMTDAGMGRAVIAPISLLLL